MSNFSSHEGIGDMLYYSAETTKALSSTETFNKKKNSNDIPVIGILI